MEANNPVKILLVDDRAENLFALEVILSNENYLCVKARSGNEALKILLHEQDFAIILMDVQMPDMDGFETAELIRETEKLKHVPIIFLTASMDSPLHIFKGYRAGAVDYMIKPFSPEILKAKVAVFVDLHKKNHELLIRAQQVKTLNSDITERIRFEKELIEAKSKAESATRIAEDAMKAKQQFLSNMSHEIRTPMNAIIGFTRVVLKTNLSEKQKEYLHAIKTSGDALIVLIDDILDLAKVDAGKMTFEQTPFKMTESISSIIQVFGTKIQENNLEFSKEYDNNIPEVLIGDPARLHQIILNLVSNAVKFTAKGKITLGIRLLNEDKERVIIGFTVTDTGIGIAENKIDHIFENFQQASTGTTRLYGGTGLGLAIVRQLVERQGGSVRVKSKIDVGSVFNFSLSFQKTEAKAELETDVDSYQHNTRIKNIKVLVVEDNGINQLLMETLLDNFGFEHDIATNGKIAIEKLQSKSYDIILMDLQMPEMNGVDTTDYIRNKMNSKIPIIAITANVTTVDLAKCKAIGMNDYLAKPFDEQLLYAKIIGLVKKPDLIK